MLARAPALIAALLVSVTAVAQEPEEEGPTEETSETSEASPREGYAVSYGGQYRVLANASNFDFHPRFIAPEEPARSFVNQRFRTWVNIHDRTRRDHGAYFQIELGHIVWGEDLDFPKTYVANGDAVGVELRRGFLWYEPTESSVIRVGILDWHDRFGERPRFDDAELSHWAVDAYDSERAPLANSVWDFNVGGVTYDFAAKDVWHGSLGALVLSEGDTLGGDGSALLFASDLDREVGASLYGVSAYYLHDRGAYSYGDFGGPSSGSPIVDSWDFWLGARGHHDFAGVRPSYFFIWNRGATESPEWRHSGWAVKGAVDYAWGTSQVSFQSFYSTGNDGSSRERSGEFRTIAQSTRDGMGAASYWSFLGLSSPRGPSDIADLGISLQNLGLGLRTVQASLSHAWSERISTYVAFGGLSSAEPRPRSGSRSMGLELLGEAAFRLGGALVLDVGGAYFWTGDFYRRGPETTSPANLYEIYARFQLELAVLAGN